ncbi:hypothetical protein THAOC_26344, partial [Thalassiosira oceanica]
PKSSVANLGDNDFVSFVDRVQRLDFAGALFTGGSFLEVGADLVGNYSGDISNLHSNASQCWTFHATAVARLHQTGSRLAVRALERLPTPNIRRVMPISFRPPLYLAL